MPNHISRNSFLLRLLKVISCLQYLNFKPTKIANLILLRLVRRCWWYALLQCFQIIGVDRIIIRAWIFNPVLKINGTVASWRSHTPGWLKIQKIKYNLWNIMNIILALHSRDFLMEGTWDTGRCLSCRGQRWWGWSCCRPPCPAPRTSRRPSSPSPWGRPGPGSWQSWSRPCVGMLW